ncbi:MAG: hypothetical protein ACLPSF_06195 [Methylocella sp.]
MEPEKPGALRQLLKKAEPPSFFVASGLLLLNAHKVNAMPVDALSHALQQTPVFTLTDAPANMLASKLKEAAGSSAVPLPSSSSSQYSRISRF